MMPVTPHVAEELWEEFGFEGMVSEAQLADADVNIRSVAAEYAEDLIRDVISDILEIIKVTGMQPKRIIIYTAMEWKRNVFSKAVQLHKEGKLDVPTLTKACMADENLRKMGKAVSDLARKVAQDYMRLPVEKIEAVSGLDELAHLLSAKDFISDEVGYNVEVISADDEEKYDPQNKSKVAVPGKPGIYLE